MSCWIVVHTRPGAEHLARLHIERQGYDAYLPLATRAGQAAPLFPRYLFVDVAPRQGIWRPIRSTVGVTAVLRTGESPSVVPQGVIDALRQAEEAGVIRARRRAAVVRLHPGQAVRVLEGPFEGFEGVFERLSGEGSVRVLLECMGRAASVEVRREAVG